MGAKGPVKAKDKCIRAVEARNDMPGKNAWLCVRQLEDGPAKRALRNASIDATV
jgi:hypothetical protein